MFLLIDSSLELAEASREIIGVPVAEVTSFDGSELSVRSSDGTVSLHTHPNMLCLGLATSDAVLAERLCAWWRARSGDELSIFTVPKGSADDRFGALLSWLHQRVLSVVRIIEIENGELIGQNMQLRRSYDALQSAFSRLEGFVVANHLHVPVLQYRSEQIASFWQPRESGTKLIQLLPVLSTRLSHFELFFRAAAGAHRGSLTLTLRVEPNARVWRVWELDYAQIVDGWQSFAPPPVVDEPNEVVLELQWSDATRAPTVGLSLGHWNTPYGATTPERDGRMRSLAMRIWSGLAGVRAPSAASTAQIDRSKPRMVSLMPNGLLRASHHEYLGGPRPTGPAVEGDAPAGRVIVHPFGHAPTIAALPDPVPRGTTFISAHCQTLEADAAEVEYALGLTGPDVLPEAIFAEAKPGEGFSGWFRLAPTNACRLSLSVTRPTDGNELLHLATRLPAGISAAPCRASFAGVEIGIGVRPKMRSVEDADVTAFDRDSAEDGKRGPAESGPRIFRIVAERRVGSPSVSVAKPAAPPEAGPSDAPTKKTGRQRRAARRT